MSMGGLFFRSRRVEGGGRVEQVLAELPEAPKPLTKESAAEEFKQALPDIMHLITIRLVGLYEERDSGGKGPNHLSLLTKEIARYEKRLAILAEGRMPMMAQADGQDEFWCSKISNKWMQHATLAKLVVNAEKYTPKDDGLTYASRAPIDIVTRIKALEPELKRLQEQYERMLTGMTNPEQAELIRRKASAYKIVAAIAKMGLLLENQFVRRHMDEYSKLIINGIYADAYKARLIKVDDMDDLFAYTESLDEHPPEPSHHGWYGDRRI